MPVVTQSVPPPITVVMPVHNRRQRIERAVVSVLAQQHRDFELIVVDDASTDGTAEAVEAVRDPRIKVLRQPHNMGANAARNRGVDAAQGDIICFLDSDDEFLPGKLAYVSRYFADNPDVDFLIDSSEMVRGESLILRRNPVLTESAEVEAAIYARRLSKSTPALNVRRAALLKVGKFDESLRRRQDMDLAVRLAREVRSATTDAILWRKHWSPDSISAQGTFMQAMIDMCDRHPEYLTNPHFRAGLSRDFARHFLRLAWRRDVRSIVRDVRKFARSPYGRTGPRLFASGIVEVGRRLFSRSAARSGRPLHAGGSEEPAGPIRQQPESLGHRAE